jgi:hypothetical protein
LAQPDEIVAQLGFSKVWLVALLEIDWGKSTTRRFGFERDDVVAASASATALEAPVGATIVSVVLSPLAASVSSGSFVSPGFNVVTCAAAEVRGGEVGSEVKLPVPAVSESTLAAALESGTVVPAGLAEQETNRKTTAI